MLLTGKQKVRNMDNMKLETAHLIIEAWLDGYFEGQDDLWYESHDTDNNMINTDVIQLLSDYLKLD